MAGFEWLRSDRFAPHTYRLDYVTLQLGIEVLLGLIVGWLMLRLLGQSTRRRGTGGGGREAARPARPARRRARGRQPLRPGAQLLARARPGLRRFHPGGARAAPVRPDRDRAQRERRRPGDGRRRRGRRERAAAGLRPSDPRHPARGAAAHEPDGLPARHEIADYPEEDEFLALGLHCRLATPLLQGARAIGMLSLVRRSPTPSRRRRSSLPACSAGSSQRGAEHPRLRGRAQDRRGARRLSALRADFVSLVSHELRTPMAAVIGSARTLQQRWRELSPDQRESFLELIAGETNRLAELIGDVLDTSRIEAGHVQLPLPGGRPRAARARLGRDRPARPGRGAAPRRSAVSRCREIRGDRDRLRQVLTNLIDNAIKYSPAGGDVEVRAYGEDGRVLVDVRDQGPGSRRPTSSADLREVRPRHRRGATRRAPASASSSRARSPRPTAACWRWCRHPSQGSTFTLELPLDRAC